jgi:endonuclease-3 related protein
LTPAAAYRRLLSSFGPRGWWPITPPGGLRPRYHPGRFPKLGEKAALEVCLGAILTQNTAWTNVEKALESLSRARAVDAGRIRRMPPRRLEALIRSSGFYVQKAMRLKAFLRAYSGPRWLSMVPREELLGIRGIGPETADSMLLYAGGRPIFIVDAYTRRIGERVGWLRPRMEYDDVRRFFEARFPASFRVYQEMHALLVELAKRCCRKTAPLCGECPLSKGCDHAQD